MAGLHLDRNTNTTPATVVVPTEEKVAISNITDISDRLIANRADINGDRFVTQRELGQYYRQNGNPLSEETLQRAFTTLARQSESTQVRNRTLMNVAADLFAGVVFSQTTHLVGRVLPVNLNSLLKLNLKELGKACLNTIFSGAIGASTGIFASEMWGNSYERLPQAAIGSSASSFLSFASVLSAEGLSFFVPISFSTPFAIGIANIVTGSAFREIALIAIDGYYKNRTQINIPLNFAREVAQEFIANMSMEGLRKNLQQ